MSIPRSLHRLVDDAAIYPPGLMPLPDAVPAHAAHRASPHADLVGPFVVPAARLAEVEARVRALALDPVGLAVVVPGVGGVGAATRRIDASAVLRLDAVEVALDPTRDLIDQVDQVAADTSALPSSVAVHVEVPRPGHRQWSDLAPRLARRGLSAKLRTGGTEAEAFPSVDELAGWIHDIVRHGGRFKCTAGLHHALAYRDPATGLDHHGFVGVLLATLVASRGGTHEEVAAAVAEREPDGVHRWLGAAGAGALGEARSWFLSYGSCSVEEPLADLASLGLLDDRSGASA
jgi:hypothetical protein